MKTWHYELMVVSLIVGMTTAFLANNIENWIVTLAVLLTFNHAQIGDRLQEQQRILSSKTVDCAYLLNNVFAAKEVVWIAAFIMLHNYAAIVGSVVFFLYPFWRKLYRNKIKPLSE